MVSRQNYFSFSFYLLMVAGVCCLALEKGSLLIFINQNFTNPTTDLFFKYFTYLGDGFVLLPLVIFLLYVKYKYAVVAAFSGLFQLILVHINKRMIFNDMVRPKIYLEGYNLHFVDGVTVHGYNSFPSGHTATAFATFFLLSIACRQSRLLQFIFFAIAFIVGFSRMYLLQHFFFDVYFGAIIGMISTFLALRVVEKYFRLSALNGNLLSDISSVKSRK